MDNHIKYCKFGVYYLDPNSIDFLNTNESLDESSDKKWEKSFRIINFLQCFGWDKGYLIVPVPDVKTLKEHLIKGIDDEKQKKIIMDLFLNSVVVDNDILDKIHKKECLVNYITCPKVKVAPHKYFPNIQIHEMKWDDLLKMFTPWFLKGHFLTFVDPYFYPADPTEDGNNSLSNPQKWYEPLNLIMERSVERKYFDEKNESTSNLQIQYHCVLRDDRLEDLLNGCKKYIKVPENCNLTISIWKRYVTRHDRFIISEVGDANIKQKSILISFSHGLDEVIDCPANIAFHHSSDTEKIKVPYSNDKYKIAEITKYPSVEWTITNFQNGKAIMS